MTTARIQYENRREDDEPQGLHVVTEVKARNARILAEVRAEIARQRVSQTVIAEECFNKSQQWLGRRLTGASDITPAELLMLADYLKVDIVPWLAAGRPEGGGTTLKATSQLAIEYLASVPDCTETQELSAPIRPDLRLVA